MIDSVFPQIQLSEVATIYSGFAFKSKELTTEPENGVPIIKIANIQDKKVLKDCKDYLPTDLYVEKYSRYFLEKDDFLIAMTGAGSVGKVGKMRGMRHRYLVNQRVAIVRTDPSKAVPEYVYQVLSDDIYESALYSLGLGAGQPNVSAKDIGSLEIPFPSLETQHKIASVLSAYDDLIENNTRRIAILEEMAQALYREWFVHFRFPGHEGVKMVAVEGYGRVPEGWEVKPLSELVETQYGYTESAQDTKVGPKYVRGKDINKTSYITWNTVPYCPINDEQFAKFKLNVSDIMVIRMADPGKVGIVEKEIDAVFASYLIRFHRKSNTLTPYYLYYFLASDRYQNYASGASTGTTRKSASAKVLTSIDIVVPPINILRKFEEQITALRQLLNNLLDKNANLRQTRDLLLPRLISGELDVSELEIAQRT